MALVKVQCPGCGGTKVYKHGTSKTGEQRYICHAQKCATRTFRLDYRYEGTRPGVDEKIISMAANASGVRDTARVLGITTDKVMSTLKKRVKSSAPSTSST